MSYPQNHTLPRSLALTGALALAAGWSLNALARQNQPPAAPPAANTPAKPKQKSAELALHGSRVDEKTGIMTGHDFRYVEDDTVVTGQKGTYNKNSKRLLAEGSLVLDDPKHHVTADKADVDNNKGKKLAIFTGNVVIVVKPSEAKVDTLPTEPVAPPKGQTGAAPITPPSADGSDKEKGSVGEERKRGVTIYCDRMEDYYKKKFAILKGHLRFTQTFTKDGKTVTREMTAEHAEYDGKNDKLILFPPVEGKDSDGQEFHFDQNVIVGTKEGEETLESAGKFTTKILLDSDDDDSAAPAPPAAEKRK